MKVDSLNADIEKKVKSRREWLKRALIGVPIVAYVAALSLPEAHADAEDLTLGESNPTSKYSNDAHTDVHLYDNRYFGFFGDYTGVVGLSGMVVAQNAANDPSAVALHAWNAGSQGIGIVCGTGSSTNDTGTALAALARVGVGTSAPTAMLDVVSTTTGPMNLTSSPPGSAPNSLIVQNNQSGNHKSQFTFRSNGVNRYSFGNDVSGDGGQDFFIYNEVASTTPFRIDSSDVIHGEFQASDLSFANGFRATEEGDGLAFKNKSGEKIAVLDDEGNFHIKGDIVKDL